MRQNKKYITTHNREIYIKERFGYPQKNNPYTIATSTYAYFPPN